VASDLPYVQDAAQIARELLIANSRVEFHGPTMRPFLRDGDLLEIRPIAPHALRRGDIVTLRVNDRMPTGRVARLANGGAVVIADAWPDFHLVVDHPSVIGKVVRRERDGHAIDCRSVTWRVHTALALLRESLRSRSGVTRRKRAQFVLAA
jgi:hypothetical protein